MYFSPPFIYIKTHLRLSFNGFSRQRRSNLKRMIFRSAEKTFFFSACRGRGICMLSESSTQTVARRSAKAPFLRYLGRKGTLIRNAFLRGGTSCTLTRPVSPCVGRGLSGGIMKAGMRDRLAFCTFPDARESRICDGGGGRARINDPRGGGIVILTLGISTGTIRDLACQVWEC